MTNIIFLFIAFIFTFDPLICIHTQNLMQKNKQKHCYLFPVNDVLECFIHLFVFQYLMQENTSIYLCGFCFYSRNYNYKCTLKHTHN